MEEQYLFPFFVDEIEEFMEDEILDVEEVYKDIAWDYDNNIPIISGGDFVIVEGLEAVKSWAFRALQTQRAKYLAFSWNYGADVESYVGKVLTTKEKIDITREIKDCLLQNKHVTNVVNFNFLAEGREITITFTILTKYGNADEVITWM